MKRNLQKEHGEFQNPSHLMILRDIPRLGPRQYGLFGIIIIHAGNLILCLSIVYEVLSNGFLPWWGISSDNLLLLMLPSDVRSWAPNYRPTQRPHLSIKLSKRLASPTRMWQIAPTGLSPIPINKINKLFGYRVYHISYTIIYPPFLNKLNWTSRQSLIFRQSHVILLVVYPILRNIPIMWSQWCPHNMVVVFSTFCGEIMFNPRSPS